MSTLSPEDRVHIARAIELLCMAELPTNLEDEAAVTIAGLEALTERLEMDRVFGEAPQ